MSFNGLGMGMGHAATAFEGEDTVDQRGELRRREGQGRDGDRGHGRQRRSRAWAGLEDLPGDLDCAGRVPGTGGHRGARRDSADLDDTGRALAASDILRIYWDGQEQPSVECPVGDFFACGWQKFAQVSSLAVCVNPGSGLNCYWEMPFRKRCRITMTNIAAEAMALFYQINYTLTEVPEDAAYFHAQFRRENPLPYKQDFTILDGVKGQGQFVGVYMAWGVNNNGWWGEGEIKFFMDGDTEFPTICGTGTEDYFCGSYGFDVGGQVLRSSPRPTRACRR